MCNITIEIYVGGFMLNNILLLLKDYPNSGYYSFMTYQDTLTFVSPIDCDLIVVLMFIYKQLGSVPYQKLACKSTTDNNQQLCTYKYLEIEKDSNVH